MKALTIIRTNDWWEYKFPPILAVGYMVIASSGYRFVNFSADLTILLLSLITGAAYVSILNDATDISDDAIAGKKNMVAGLPIFKTISLVAIPLIAGVIFSYYYASDKLTTVLYTSCYVCFTLYSLPPFRLKKKGVAGIIADAAGSQLFPSLFIAAYLCFRTRQAVDYYQLILIGAWSFCFGLRGILWHQYHDLEKDLLSGTKTIVHRLNNKDITITGNVLMVIEFSSFTILLLTFKLLLPAIMMMFYFLYLLALYKQWKVRTVLIRPPAAAYRIFMNEYYQVFLPLSILFSSVFEEPSVLVILLFHILLFPANMLRIIRECCKLLLKVSMPKSFFNHGGKAEVKKIRAFFDKP